MCWDGGGVCECGVVWQQHVCMAGTYRHAVGNALFSFPLQKTGHSRRFGRFTHGALSYQDLTPPVAPQVCWDGSTTMPQGAASRGWARLDCLLPATKQGPSQAGAHSVLHTSGLLLALKLYMLRGCQTVVAGIGNLMH